MGLDISFRFKKIDAKPLGYEYGAPVYRSDDIHDCNTSFYGRTPFACIREWVGDDRYGKFITLDPDTLDELICVVQTELNRQEAEAEAEEDKNALEYVNFVLNSIDSEHINCYSLYDFYAFILKASTGAEKIGWCLEIECDW